MNHTTWGDDFIEILYKKFPKKSQLITALMNLLEIEREAVYRRLRKDVFFSAHEVVKIASAWNISLDEITRVSSEQFAFHMKQMNYLDPSVNELTFLRSVIQSIDYLKNIPNTEFMDICNKLPRQLVSGYFYLNKLLLFKWMYQYGETNKTIPYSEIQTSEEKIKLTEEYNKAIKNVPNNNFILDNKIFEFLLNDIKYFASIYLITNEEKKLIKKDILALLDYMQEIANKGYYPETNCKVNLYISHLNIDTNYSYTLSSEANICYIHVFEKFEIYTFDSDLILDFINWMQMKKRTSIQISEVDERSRVEFFTKQRALIENLL